jgi:hypothetical protein
MKRTPLIASLLALLTTAMLILAGCGSPVENTAPVRTADTCAVGTAGCQCNPDATCGTGLICMSGVCAPATCTKGDKGCPCDNGLCKPNGTCVDNTCVDPTGTIGNSCYANSTCNVGAKCNNNVCVTCDKGTAGCACLPTDSGLTCVDDGAKCINNTCIGKDNVHHRPLSMNCYIPCTGEVISDAGNFKCNQANNAIQITEGQACPFLLGPTPLTCSRGACTGGSLPKSCATDSECPEMTACLDGVCASECNLNFECGDGFVCANHVCRSVCGAGSLNDCTSVPGFTCQRFEDGTGQCMPTQNATDGGTTTTINGSATITPRVVDFGTYQGTGKNSGTQTVTITNNGDQPHLFTITKVSHVDYTKIDPRTQQPPYAIPRGGDAGVDDAGHAIGDTPLTWLAMGAPGQSSLQNSYSVSINANQSANIELKIVTVNGGPPPDHWEGKLNVASDYGPSPVDLIYAGSNSGHWVGQVYYFESFGDQGLDAWIASNRTTGTVQNALVNKWLAYRSNLPGVGISLNELEDVITSTVNETWLDPGITSQCGGGYCYPTNQRTSGLGKYSTDDDQTMPIPRGPVKIQMGMDLFQQGNILYGKINSTDSLQYAGDPNIQLTFGADPTSCDVASGTKDSSGRCRVWATDMSATIVTGARYIASPSDGRCSTQRVLPDGGAADAGDLVLAKTPWLVPGFVSATTPDPSSGLRYTYECRDTTEPLMGAAAAGNANLAGSNPIPDGRSRQRKLELVDGLVYDSETMLILFRERFDSTFLGALAEAGAADGGFLKYGIMTLKRAPQPPTLTAPPPPQPADTRQGAVQLQNARACDDATTLAFGSAIPVASLTAVQANALLATVVDGLPGNATSPCPAPSGMNAYASNLVHYLCKTTNQFDTAGICSNSDITYFAFSPTDTTNANRDLSKDACNTLAQGRGTCDHMLQQLVAAQLVDTSPVWKCSSSASPDCDNVTDMRLNKSFFPSNSNAGGGALPSTQVYVPLQTAIDQAFRYKTQFASRDGTSAGFAPTICQANTSAVPYCYDPVAITQLQGRLSCLNALYSSQYTNLYGTVQPPQATCGITIDNRTRATALLKQQFAYTQDVDPTGMNPNMPKHYGLEFLNAELLIMLGDDAYTNAFESRFDLAGSLTASFQGSLFEPKGADLAGGAGFELYELYQAAQYYQLILDHFFSISPYIWQSIRYSASDATRQRSFIDANAVVSYFSKLTRASTQKSRAWGEVAKRYQQLNRPDLARLVVQRSYSATYIESILFGRFLTTLVTVADPKQVTQVRSILDYTKRTYQAALLDMQDVFSKITDNVTYFGFPADYVPFPVVQDNTGQNAFDLVMTAANAALADAKDKEDLAIAQDRSYETDSTAFQAQLTQIRNQYDNQLAQICGTFTGDDAKIYPAIPKYAPLGSKGTNPSNPNGAPRLMGDPCGFVGNGQISNAIDELSMARVDAQKVQVQSNNLQAEINNEIDHAAKSCNIALTAAQFQLNIDSQDVSLNDVLIDSKVAQSQYNAAMDLTQKIVSMSACIAGIGGTDCPSKAAVAAALGMMGASQKLQSAQMETAQANTQKQIEALKTTKGQWQVAHACDQLQLDSATKITNLALGFKELDLEALKQTEALHLALANILSLRNQATRLEQEQNDAAQLAVDAAAAKNDPNTRIYKNDAIINADSSFKAALQAAYKATKVFEYYTSQSYAHKIDLTLVRLVSHGDYNLANYLRSLQTAYAAFQDTYGRPDVRLVAMSLCDEMLKIPYYDAHGPLSREQRTALCRAEVLNPARLDANGYIRLPFSTSAAQLSPITRNHKILYVEGNFATGGVPGNSADVRTHVFAPRIYLRQAGTGTVNALDGSREYFRFPERTAVIDSRINGLSSPALTEEVYRNDRLRDRPFINTSWDITLNLRDEPANVDINMAFFEDIQLWFYYTDFSAL